MYLGSQGIEQKAAFLYFILLVQHKVLSMDREPLRKKGVYSRLKTTDARTLAALRLTRLIYSQSVVRSTSVNRSRVSSTLVSPWKGEISIPGNQQPRISLFAPFLSFLPSTILSEVPAPGTCHSTGHQRSRPSHRSIETNQRLAMTPSSTDSARTFQLRSVAQILNIDLVTDDVSSFPSPQTSLDYRSRWDYSEPRGIPKGCGKESMTCQKKPGRVFKKLEMASRGQRLGRT